MYWRQPLLIPEAAQFQPVDNVVTGLLHSLAGRLPAGSTARPLQLDDLRIEFDCTPSGARFVRWIRGRNCQLYFARGALSPSSHRGPAVQAVMIPRMILQLFGNEAGPVLELYVGKDYRADQPRFFSWDRPEDLAAGPRWLVRYTGGWDHPRQCRPGVRPTRLLYDDMGGRLHPQEPDDPDSLALADAMQQVGSWLERHLLPQVTALPVIPAD
ncbi:hypothetical protein JNJ66_00930 [Candidatus Saccharibacteria bacterium]|nr:hypothetical protein [Candidatus Saccharibacteria bacterium]